jgi:hypothetical protein
MTPVQTAKLVAVLIAAFPNQQVSTGTVEVYERMLADLEVNAATAAVQRLIGLAKFLPTVADIREAALALTSGERRPGGDAWGDVLRAIGTHGYMRTPGKDFRFDDPVTARCVSQLGWRELCDSTNAQADRARFIELYDELAKTTRRDELTRALPAVARQRELRSGETKPLRELLLGAIGDQGTRH